MASYFIRAVARAKRLAVLAAAFALSGCAVLDHGIMAAAGPVAAQERHLFLLVCFVMLFVIGPVAILTPIFAWHYRLSNTRHAYRPEWGFNWTLEGFIWIPPVIIVAILGLFLWRDTHALDPYRPLPSALPPTRVQAIALDWKWVFVYPDDGIATVNQLVFPADRPVHLELTSGTVMQSLLFPRLAGQIYAMSGMTTQLNIAADKPGEYRGENTQFNGDGFQNEKFPVRALAPDDYARWLATAHSASSRLDIDDFRALADKRATAGQQVYGSVAPHLFDTVVTKDRQGMSSVNPKAMQGMDPADMKSSK